MKQNIFWLRNVDAAVKLVLLFEACYQRARSAEYNAGEQGVGRGKSRSWKKGQKL